MFKPGYNVQMGNSNGYIRHIYVSSDANDLNTYIPFVECYQKAYGSYPEKTPADTGYGSYDNYSYCNEHCERCPLRSQCTRSKNGRTLQITDKLNELQSEAKENLSTEIGKELMKQRSIQTEGIFGQIKQDQEYDRL